MEVLYSMVFGLLLHQSYSMPAENQQEVTTSEPCVKAATALGDILINADTLATPYISAGSFYELVRHAVGLNVFDEDVRRDVMCAFNDLSTLSQFHSVLETLEIEFQIFKAAYDYLALAEPYEKHYIQQSLEDQLAPSDERNARIMLKLCKQLEASGFLNLDSNTVDLYMAAIGGLVNPTGIQISKEPLSTSPIEVQCLEVTNSLRKLWNAYVKEIREYNPNAGQELRATIKAFTGIDLSGHEHIRTTICQIMTAASTHGFDGIYRWLKNRGVFDHLLKAGYPHMVRRIDDVTDLITYMVYGQTEEIPSVPSEHSNARILQILLEKTGRQIKTDRRNHSPGALTRDGKAQAKAHHRQRRTSPPYDYANYGGYGNNDQDKYPFEEYPSGYPDYGYGQPDYGYYNYYHHDPAPELTHLYIGLLSLLDSLREMNIFCLEDDMILA